MILLQETLFWDLCLISDVRVAKVSSCKHVYIYLITRLLILNEVGINWSKQNSTETMVLQHSSVRVNLTLECYNDYLFNTKVGLFSQNYEVSHHIFCFNFLLGSQFFAIFIILVCFFIACSYITCNWVTDILEYIESAVHNVRKCMLHSIKNSSYY